jgi:hypothetical protein
MLSLRKPYEIKNRRIRNRPDPLVEVVLVILSQKIVMDLFSSQASE